MSTTTTAPRVWVGCLGCYNGGDLVGEWVPALDAGQYGDGTEAPFLGLMRAAGAPSRVMRDHVAEGHEELWCFDFEGFGGVLSGECSPDQAQVLAEVLELVDDHDRPAFEAWLAYDQGRTTEVDADTVDTFRDAYQGTFRDVGDFAAELLSDQVEAALGEQLAYYFDYDQYGRDLLSQGWTALVAPACEEFGFAPVYVFRDE